LTGQQIGGNVIGAARVDRAPRALPPAKCLGNLLWLEVHADADAHAAGNNERKALTAARAVPIMLRATL